MDRRWNILFLIPLLTALIAFVFTQQIIYTGIGFVVGYLLMQGLRFLILPPNLHKAVRRYQAGDVESALELADKAVAARPDRWESYYLRGVIYFSLGDLPAAEENAARAVAMKPDNDSNQTMLGQILYAQQRFEEARAVFAEAVRLRGQEGVNQFHLGAALFRLGECDEAVPRLELAGKLGIPNEQMELLAHYYRGRCLERQGREEEAAAAFERVAQLIDALPQLKADVERAENYPGRSLLEADVAGIERQVPQE